MLILMHFGHKHQTYFWMEVWEAGQITIIQRPELTICIYLRWRRLSSLQFVWEAWCVLAFPLKALNLLQICTSRCAILQLPHGLKFSKCWSKNQRSWSRHTCFLPFLPHVGKSVNAVGSVEAFPRSILVILVIPIVPGPWRRVPVPFLLVLWCQGWKNKDYINDAVVATVASDEDILRLSDIIRNYRWW